MSILSPIFPWTVRGALANFARAKQLFEEASKECESDGSVKNLLGVLPFGQNFDDPHEDINQYGRDLLNKPFSTFVIDVLTYGTYRGDG